MNLPILNKTNKSLVPDLFDEFWDPFNTSMWKWNTSMPISQFFDSYYEGDDLVISCDLAGVKPADIHLETQSEHLRVQALRRGRKDTKYEHSIRISKQYDVDSAEAVLEQGVLTVRFKKLPSAKAKKVTITQK